MDHPELPAGALLRRTRQLVALAAVLLPVFPVEEVAAQPSGLFTAVEPASAAATTTRVSPTPPDSLALRRRLVTIDLGQLTPAADAAPPASADPTMARPLALNLFDDVLFSATVERTARTSSGGYALSGSLDGVEFGTMTLVVNGNVVAGTVHTPFETYSIRSLGDGVSVIQQMDRSFQCELWTPFEVGGAPGDTGNPAFLTPEPGVDPSAARVEDGSVIDLLVVYTPAARSGFGGTRQIEAFIDLAVADLNWSLENSGVIQRINLVRQEEVAYAESSEFWRHLVDPNDGKMDDVHTRREAYAADLVHLIQAGSYLGGQAELVGAFGATHYDKLGIMPHELGHHMGVAHDRYNDSNNYPFPYSHGYINQAAFEPGAPHTSRFATIMSYNSQCGDAGFFCPWTNTFSNPDMTYNGYPMGVPGDEPSSAVDGPADARRSLNELRKRVANFRVRESGPDLVVQSPSVSDSTLRPNQAFTLSAEVRNIGDVPAATTIVSYYRSPDSAISAADTPVGTSVASGLGAGGTGSASIDLTAPEQPGIYYYGACVHGVGDETSLSNNCSWGAWVVVGDGTDTACWNDLGMLQIPAGTVRTASFSGKCDTVIYYAFTLGRTAQLTIEMTSPSVNTFLVLARGGRFVETAGDGGEGTNARITRELAADGYTIWAVGYPDGVKGPFTLKVIATGPEPMSFTDHPIVSGVTLIKAIHFTELRSRIDVLRAGTGLAAYGWTDSVVTAGATPVRLVHLLELRTALEAVYASARLPVPPWTDTVTAAAETPIKAVHLMELRAAVVALE